MKHFAIGVRGAPDLAAARERRHRALLQASVAEAPRAGAVAPRTPTEQMVLAEFGAVLERQGFKL
jgi:hypothetical protein